MIINNKEEYEEFYPYDKKYIKIYPKGYPCEVKLERMGGGLMCEYVEVSVIYFIIDETAQEAVLMVRTLDGKN